VGPRALHLLRVEGMPELWLKALGLALIFEAFMPFVAPNRWRETMRKLGDIEPSRIRQFALVALAVGTGLLWL